MGIGYAPGGNLRRHLAALGYSFDRLLDSGLISSQGRDAFCHRVIFPCRQRGQIVNLYGRSIGAAFPHRLLPRSSKDWESVSSFSTVILVEGLFDLAVLWQAGFRNTTCAIGTKLNAATRHLLEMYRRQFSDDKTRRRLQRLDHRLLAITQQLQNIAVRKSEERLAGQSADLRMRNLRSEPTLSQQDSAFSVEKLNSAVSARIRAAAIGA
jgi:hypothetical protein